MTAERLESICEKCGQPRGAHALDCPVYLENLEAVKKEYSNFQKIEEIKEKYDVMEGLTPEYKKQVALLGKDRFDKQMAEIEKNIQTAAETEREENLKEFLKKGEKEKVEINDSPMNSEEFSKKFAMLEEKIMDCGDLLENIPETQEKNEIFYEVLGVAKNIENLKSFNQESEKLRLIMYNYGKMLEALITKCKNLLNKTNK